MKQDITKGGIEGVQINMWAKGGVLWEAAKQGLDSLVLNRMKSLHFSSLVCTKEQREYSQAVLWGSTEGRMRLGEISPIVRFGIETSQTYMHTVCAAPSPELVLWDRRLVFEAGRWNGSFSSTVQHRCHRYTAEMISVDVGKQTESEFKIIDVKTSRDLE